MRRVGLSGCIALGISVSGTRAAGSRGAILACLLAVSTIACTHVAPYERGKLAHPMMTADDLQGPAAAHVIAVQEGATGGGALSESGCGCN